MNNSNINYTQVADITADDLQSLQLQPVQGDPTDNQALITPAWNVVSVLFAIAIYGFMIAMLIGGVQYLFSMGGEEGVAKAKKTFMNALLGLIIVFFSYGVLTFIIDQFGPSLQEGSFSVASLVGQIFGFVIPLSAAGFLLVFLYGGFTYLTAAGNEEHVEKATKTITNSIIGMVLVALSYGIGRIVLSTLGIF